MATAYIEFTPGENFASGILYSMRLDSAVTSQQAVVSGLNSVTVDEGLQYTFWIVSSNASGEVSGDIAGPIYMLIPYVSDGDDLTIKWKTDYDADWYSAEFNTGETRIRIPTKRRGHSYQFEISGDGQNQRLELRNFATEVRVNGLSFSARQS
jgi:hypothetical protein